MKKNGISFFTELANLYLNRFLEIIGIPISILLVILGTYGAVLDYNLLNNEKISKNLLNFFLDEKKIADKKEEIETLSTEKPVISYTSKTINHFIIIDITKSGVNYDYNKSCSKFLNTIFKNEKIDNSKRTVKNGLIKCLLENYSKQTKQSINLWVSLYDGNDNFIEATGSKWLKSSDGDTRGFISKTVWNEIKKSNSKTQGQETNFYDVIDKTKKILKEKENGILTIISDFENEVGNLSNMDVRALVSQGIKKVNVIYLPSKNKNNSNSGELIDNIKAQENSTVDVIDLRVNTLINNKRFNKSQTISKIKDLINRSCKLSNIHNGIEFYYPRKDNNGNNILNRKVYLEDSTFKKWCISSRSNWMPKGEYFENVTKYSYTLNGDWETVNNTTISINLPIKNSFSNLGYLYLDTIDNNGDINRYPIIYRKYIPLIVCEIAILVIWLLFGLLFFLLVAKLIQTYEQASSDKIQEISKVVYDLLTVIFMYVLIYIVMEYLFKGFNLKLIISLTAFVHFLFFISLFIYTIQGNNLNQNNKDEE